MTKTVTYIPTARQEAMFEFEEKLRDLIKKRGSDPELENLAHSYREQLAKQMTKEGHFLCHSRTDPEFAADKRNYSESENGGPAYPPRTYVVCTACGHMVVQGQPCPCCPR